MRKLTFNNPRLTNSINNWLDDNYVNESRKGTPDDLIRFSALVGIGYCLPFGSTPRENVIEHLDNLVYNWKLKNGI